MRYTFHNGTQHAELPVRLEIAPLVIQPRRDFDVIHWWRGEAIWDYYKTGMFDEKWWQLTRAYMADMLDHGRTWSMCRSSSTAARRSSARASCWSSTSPKPGCYEFDWAQVKRFTDMAKSVGFKKFEWSHLWIYWGVENPIRVYTQRDGKWVMLWPPDTKATSDTYLNFLKQFLPAFHQFLTRGEHPGDLLLPPVRRAGRRPAHRELQARPQRAARAGAVDEGHGRAERRAIRQARA